MDKLNQYAPYAQMVLELLVAGVAGYQVAGRNGALSAMVTYAYGKFTKRPQDK